MKARTGFNPKRRLERLEAVSPKARIRWAAGASYLGNPVHKRSPGDFGLDPPASPRPGKTLCDQAGIHKKAIAAKLLSDGIKKGMVSRQQRNGWPQNIWAVLDEQPFEAELDNEVLGSYHGYPMPAEDDFRDTILTEWKER